MKYVIHRNSILIALLFSIILLFSTSLATENVVIDIASVEPAELSGSGTVTISFELSNHSESDLSSISITIDDKEFDFPDSTAIPASGSAKLPIALPISEAQLDKPLIFTVKWLSDGEPFFASAETIVSKTVDPTIILTRKLSTKHARAGQQVTVTYVLKNPTKFDMTEVTLIDEQISDDPIRKNDTLRANGSFSIEYSFVMGTKDIVSLPVVTYLVNEKTKSFSNIKPVTVAFSDVSVDISAEKKETDINGTAFEIQLTNTGTSDVFNVTVMDSDGNTVNSEPIDLKAGNTQKFFYQAAPLTSNQPKQVFFTFKGIDAYKDELESKNTGVFLINPYYDDSQFSVYFSLCVLNGPTQDNHSAEIKFSIDNKSLLPLSDIRIVEPSMGEIIHLDSLPSGLTDIIQWISVDPDTDLEFFIEGRDDSGSNHQLNSVKLSNEFFAQESSAIIEDTATLNNDTNKSRTENLWSNFVFRILVIIVSVMVLACAILLTITVFEKFRSKEPELEFWSQSGWDMSEHEGPYEQIADDSAPITNRNDGTKNMVSPDFNKMTRFLSDGFSPKHMELKKRPAKKKTKKMEIKRIKKNEI